MYFIWSLSPVAFSIAGFEIRWYGLLFASGFFIAYKVFEWAAIKEGFTRTQTLNVLLCIVIGTLVGGRLGAVLYHPEICLADPGRIFDIRKSGNASHGATVGMFVAVFVYVTSSKISLTKICDCLCIAIGFGAGCIRLGNFCNSELVGVPTGNNWGVVFTRVDSVPRHPVVLYEAVLYFTIFALMLWCYRKRWIAQPGFRWGVFFVLVFGGRILLECFKDMPIVIPTPFPMTMGQVLSVPFVLIGVLLLLPRRNRNRDFVKA